ncbi:MAG: PhnD/SsuA/transferrin family substrate-binding protein [Candidatus Thiodiazotropha sp.]
MNSKHCHHQGLAWIIGLILLTAVSASADDTYTLRVGGSAESLYDMRITDLEILIGLLFTEIFKDDDVKLKIKVYDSDQALSKQLATGNLDAVFMNPIHYLENSAYLNKEYTYAVQHGPSAKTKYILLTRRDNSIDNLQALRNKKLIIPSGHLVGERFLDVELMRSGMPVASESFSEIRYTDETNAAIINLFFGKVDAALVTEFTYDIASELNRQIPQTLQTITKSQPLIHLVVSLRKDFPAHLVDKFLPFADMLNEYPRMHFLKRNFRFEGIRKVTADDIRAMSKLNNVYVQLKRELSAK